MTQYIKLNVDSILISRQPQKCDILTQYDTHVPTTFAVL